jgi:3'-phosphoadenosine 5'-phosphosulfate (PAPS) 3'-phosphatase
MTKPAAEDLAAPGADVESTPVVSSVVVNPANNSIVYAANPSGVFRSADAGKTWTQINTGLTNTVIKSLAVNNIKLAVVYASTSDSKFFIYTEE